MKLNKLRLKDKSLFNRFLKLARHELSVYAFENIYIWRGLFDIEWSMVQGSLLVFFKDKLGAFLYLSPLGGKFNPEAVEEAFVYLNKINKNNEASRVENIEAGERASYEGLGYEVKFKSYDYLCSRTELAKLSGNKFKSKRSSANYFTKHNKFEYLPFSPGQRNSCLKLYRLWRSQRASLSRDHIYQSMIDDSLSCLKLLLKDYRSLSLKGGMVKIGGEVKGFTFGFRLNPETFCVLYEITDLSIKGLAQFIFRSFCAELKGYRYINIMDDSGLKNLERVKLSYKPLELIPAYIAGNRNG